MTYLCGWRLNKWKVKDERRQTPPKISPISSQNTGELADYKFSELCMARQTLVSPNKSTGRQGRRGQILGWNKLGKWGLEWVEYLDYIFRKQPVHVVIWMLVNWLVLNWSITCILALNQHTPACISMQVYAGAFWWLLKSVCLNIWFCWCFSLIKWFLFYRQGMVTTGWLQHLRMNSKSQKRERGKRTWMNWRKKWNWWEIHTCITLHYRVS